jgi:hypothetical protein
MSYHITNPNDTAFPDQHLIGQGLTKREFFACQALIALARFSPYPSTKTAIKIADELIQELNKNQTNE